MNFEEDIFIVDCWLDTESKEEDLISLIKKLREFDIPILLAGHYPVKPEIQKMVDYYIFDKENPILLREEFTAYDVASTRWTVKDNWKVENCVDFHHDYAIWTTWKNAFNFAKFLGKKYIHFLEYDNLIDTYQFRQGFIEEIRRRDVVLYEYREGSAQELGEFCATFIFSIRTDIGIEVINKVKDKRDYFMNKPNGWQLERVFLKYVKEVTNNITVSKYIANDNELNTQAVWNRDGVLRNGEPFQIYLAAEPNKDLYIHLISGFFEMMPTKDLLVEVVYGKYKKFHTIKLKDYNLEKIGRYRKGDRVKVYYQGVEVFNEFLKDNFDKFYLSNKVTINKACEPSLVKSNFIDGPFVEILDDTPNDYHVEFLNKTDNIVEYINDVKSNSWCKAGKQYFVEWKIKISGRNYVKEIDFDLTGKKVLISFESKSLGDTIAWIPYVDEFRKKHNCNVVCCTFHNYLFKSLYPEIKFVLPGVVVHDLYALYRIGFFKKENQNVYEDLKHPNDPKTIPLQQIATDILGLEYTEIRPELFVKNSKGEKLTFKKKKQVSIAIHSTAQCKYWNNPSGWQDVVDHLKINGYDVMVLSSEEDGYMGNYNPIGTTRIKAGPIPDLIKTIQESELFIGISSGLSWLSWACGTPTILISGFTDDTLEPKFGVNRVINKYVCHGCWSRHEFDPGDWNWCPEYKDTERHFECSKKITSKSVILNIDQILKIN